MAQCILWAMVCGVRQAPFHNGYYGSHNCTNIWGRVHNILTNNIQSLPYQSNKHFLEEQEERWVQQSEMCCSILAFEI